MKTSRQKLYAYSSFAATLLAGNAVHAQVTYVDIDPDLIVDGDGTFIWQDLNADGEDDVLFFHAYPEGYDKVCSGGILVSYSAVMPVTEVSSMALPFDFGQFTSLDMDWSNFGATILMIKSYGMGHVALDDWSNQGDKFLMISGFDDEMQSIWLRLNVGDCGYTVKDYAYADMTMHDFYAGIGMPCSAPQPLGAFVITPTSAKLKWEGVVNADEYDLFYRPVGAPGWTKKHVAATEKKIKGLTCNTGYEWKVRSACDDENSAFSAIQTFTTAACRMDGQDEMFSEVSVYPNPASDVLHIEMENRDDVAIEIFDITGSRISNVMFSETDGIISADISQFSKGIYFLTISTTFSTKTIQFIHQ